MVFGEIIEPSSRALIYEEDEDVLQLLTREDNLEWEISCELPSVINAFLIAETQFTNKIIESCLIGSHKPVACTKGSIITIYKFEDTKSQQKYIALCNLPVAGCAGASITIGQVTEKLLPWIQAAEKCYSFITLPTASYQNKNMMERSFYLLRMLSTTNEKQLCPRLETPNLITGIGANCLSHCIFANQACSLFIGYIDYAPIDSENSKPFIDLLKQVGFDSHGKTYKLIDKLPENNLYI